MSRRGQIQLTPAEQLELLDSERVVIVSSHGPRGWPHSMPMWFTVRDGEIWIWTYGKSQKVKNLERDPRVTMLLEDGEVYDKLRGVSIQGRAVLHKDVEKVHELHQAVLRRNTPELTDEVIEKVSLSMAPKKTAIVVVPEKTVSWDHTKLGGIY